MANHSPDRRRRRRALALALIAVAVLSAAACGGRLTAEDVRRASVVTSTQLVTVAPDGVASANVPTAPIGTAAGTTAPPLARA